MGKDILKYWYWVGRVIPPRLYYKPLDLYVVNIVLFQYAFNSSVVRLQAMTVFSRLPDSLSVQSSNQPLVLRQEISPTIWLHTSDQPQSYDHTYNLRLASRLTTSLQMYDQPSDLYYQPSDLRQPSDRRPAFGPKTIVIEYGLPSDIRTAFRPTTAVIRSPT